MTADRPPDPPIKKPYERPRLEIYGDIRQVTQGEGHSAGWDSGAAHGKTGGGGKTA